MEQALDVQELNATVKTLQARVNALDYELRAWQVRAHKYCPRCGGPSVDKRPVNPPFSSLPLTDAVLVVLAEGEGRIAIRKMREILEEKGLKSKLGRYGNSLRTDIGRLVIAGRILKEGDTIEMLK